jgi:hypothetical protein
MAIPTSRIGRTVLAAAILGTALAVAGWFLAQTIIQKEVKITAGEGMLKEVFIMPPKECHGGYINAVSGTKAEVNMKIHVPFTPVEVPTTFRASEGFTGDVTDEVCNTGINGQKTVDTKNHKITIDIPPEALQTTVYQTNPADAKAWTSDNGMAVAIMKNAGNVIKTLPAGLDLKAGDELQAKLRGWALLSAYDLSTKGCGNTAWPHLKPLYAVEIKKGIVDQNNSALGATKITLEDVTVNLPDKVGFKNQYEEQFAAIQDKLVKSGVNFTMPDPSKFVCRDMPAGSSVAK